MNPVKKMKIKKGDTVKIIAGKDKGKTGKVASVFPSLNKIVVEGINIAKKKQRPVKQGQKGQIIQIAMPISVSNAMILCPVCSSPARTGSKQTENKKIRVCKKCGGEI